MLTRTPVESTPQRQAYCVVGKEFYCGFAFVVVSCSPESVILEKTQTTQNAIEGPDDESGPDIIAEPVAKTKADGKTQDRMVQAQQRTQPRVHGGIHQ